jgi:hypothetical protein
MWFRKILFIKDAPPRGCGRLTQSLHVAWTSSVDVVEVVIVIVVVIVVAAAHLGRLGVHLGRLGIHLGCLGFVQGYRLVWPWSLALGSTWSTVEQALLRRSHFGSSSTVAWNNCVSCDLIWMTMITDCRPW